MAVTSWQVTRAAREGLFLPSSAVNRHSVISSKSTGMSPLAVSLNAVPHVALSSLDLAEEYLLMSGRRNLFGPVCGAQGGG